MGWKEEMLLDSGPAYHVIECRIAKGIFWLQMQRGLLSRDTKIRVWLTFDWKTIDSMKQDGKRNSEEEETCIHIDDR